jgi:hypothetical protein
LSGRPIIGEPGGSAGAAATVVEAGGGAAAAGAAAGAAAAAGAGAAAAGAGAAMGGGAAGSGAAAGAGAAAGGGAAEGDAAAGVSLGCCAAAPNVNAPKKAPASNRLRGDEPIIITFSPLLEAIVSRAGKGGCRRRRPSGAEVSIFFRPAQSETCVALAGQARGIEMDKRC